MGRAPLRSEVRRRFPAKVAGQPGVYRLYEQAARCSTSQAANCVAARPIPHGGSEEAGAQAAGSVKAHEHYVEVCESPRGALTEIRLIRPAATAERDERLPVSLPVRGIHARSRDVLLSDHSLALPRLRSARRFRSREVTSEHSSR